MRYPLEDMKIKGRMPTPQEIQEVKDRTPAISIEESVTVRCGPHQLAKLVAEEFMYVEIMWFLRTLLKEVDDPVLVNKIYEEVNGRVVAKRLMEEQDRLPKRVEIDDSELPDNPFDLGTKGNRFGLHQIIEEREKLIGKPNLSLLEKLWLYRLRIAELLHLMDDADAHFVLLREEHKKLKGEYETICKEKNCLMLRRAADESQRKSDERKCEPEECRG